MRLTRPHSSPFSRNVPSIISTQPPPTCADTIAPFALTHAGQEQARPAHVDALPDPQFQFAVAFAGEVGEHGGRGHRGAAGGGILG